MDGGQNNLQQKRCEMEKPILSGSTISELKEYLAECDVSSKRAMTTEIRDYISHILEDCDCVYVSDNGNVIHATRYCGNAYSSLVPFEIAYAHGYRKLCTKCALGSYAEQLLYKKEPK